MSRFRMASVGLAGVAGLLIPASAAHAADTSSLWGCPSGAVCIYADAKSSHLNGNYITNTYWSYGPHNLSNEFNDHWVVNNQTGGINATAVLCDGYNGTKCTGIIDYPGVAIGPNLTPINSIVLNRP